MELLTKGVRGTKDTLPGESHLFRYLERTALEVSENFGYFELRSPVFEHTELFERGVGDTTDVVQKEMYTFFDKGGRSITLRPEGTAGVARACLEHGLLNATRPVKVSYIANCYRYEKPQAGRYREFRQFGVECFGAAEPRADAELISLAVSYFSFIGLEKFHIELNSIGCPACRTAYLEALTGYFSAQTGRLCETCHTRLGKNPMRILDCKSPICSEIAQKSPEITQHLCTECKDHFQLVTKQLDLLEIPYQLNPRIVRGLDYYTRTVFELVSDVEELNNLVLGGGGRYDGLIEQLGGAHTPSLGFGIGLERILYHLKIMEVSMPEQAQCMVYFGVTSESSQNVAITLAAELREEGFSAQYDIVGRSLKAQMKHADKIGALYTCVLGDQELEHGRVQVKRMATGAEETLPLATFVDSFEHFLFRYEQEALQECFEKM